MPKIKKLFTVIVDYEGTTLVEQYHAANLGELLTMWRAQTQAKITIKKLSDTDRDFVLLDGLTNVWCTSLVDDKDVFFLLNVVETAKD